MARSNTELRAGCQHFLSGHLPRTPREWFSYLSASSAIDLPMDFYNQGPSIAQLEREVAEILGKEAAIFMHKGVVAQQVALRVWADRCGKRTVALHPKSHIDLDERNAYEQLHQLRGLPIGKDYRPFTLEDLKRLHEPLGSVVIELPLRHVGYKLVSWDELIAISKWTHEQGAFFHIDGARLWESAPFYGKSYAEIAALADSVYVSFYKGLGGLAGSVLAGPANFIAEARAWRTRMGGDIYTVFPFVLSALEGLHHHLPRMERYFTRAQEIAAALAEIPGVRIIPNPPQTNAFQIHLPATLEELQKAVVKLAENEKTWLFGWFEETAYSDLTMAEVTVGEATEQWTTAEIVAAIRKFLDYAKEA